MHDEIAPDVMGKCPACGALTDFILWDEEGCWMHHLDVRILPCLLEEAQIQTAYQLPRPKNHQEWQRYQNQVHRLFSRREAP